MENPLDDEELIYSFAKFIRTELGLKDKSRINLVVSMGFIPKLNSFLSIPSNRIQIEAAWSLCNIAAGETQFSKELAESEKALVSLIDTKDLDLSENVIRYYYYVWISAYGP